MESKIYWKEAVKILNKISESDEKISISETMKLAIKNKIVNSIHNENYLVSKLLIRSKITKEIILNFLFYNAINKEKTYILYCESPTKYCKTYMFNISPQNLPNLNLVFDLEEVELLSSIIEIEKIINEIGQCSIQKLKRLFPKAFHFSDRNPHSDEIY